MNPDIATLLESHRRHMLESAKAHVDPKEYGRVAGAIEHDHDRATTKTLLDLYRSGNAGNGQQQVGHATFSVTNAGQPVAPSRKVKAGSKKARDRALKAGETRRKNLAARADQQQSQSQSQATDTPPAGEQVQP